MKNIIRKPEDNRMAQLENEITRLKKKITKYEAIELKQNRFGLVWLDVPEAFEDDVENKLPILEEVPKLAINSKDGKPTHLLIEGDNYHALTCLNYTHKEKIDVIYIDPPYNTGSDGFKYKDKRFLDKYPDGTEVPIDHPLRHSYWLSFMKKRLELARDLLKKSGLIFISIDDNELAQLKLLCDEIFLERNFVNNITVKSSESSGVKMNHTEKKLPKIKEYLLVYANDVSQIILNPIKISKSGNIEKFKSYAKYYSKIIENPNDEPEKWSVVSLSEYFKKNKITIPSENDLIKFKLDNADRIVYRTNNRTFLGLKFKTPIAKISSATGLEYIWWEGKQMLFLSDYTEESLCDLWSDISTINLNKEMTGLPSFSNGQKPLQLIKRILKLHINKNAVILDFFAGSGTTAHATLEQNEEDAGKRQCILITNNDEVVNGEKYKIMSDRCYPRIKNVIRGKSGGIKLGNSMRYFKTAFVGKNNILEADDTDKIDLAHNAGGMLAIAENTFDQVEQNNYWQIFESNKQYTAIYFREEFSKFDNFIEKVRKLKKPVVVYIFSWEKEFEFNEFEDDKNIKVKTIPQPILEIYKNIYNLV